MISESLPICLLFPIFYLVISRTIEVTRYTVSVGCHSKTVSVSCDCKTVSMRQIKVIYRMQPLANMPFILNILSDYFENYWGHWIHGIRELQFQLAISKLQFNCFREETVLIIDLPYICIDIYILNMNIGYSDIWKIANMPFIPNILSDYFENYWGHWLHAYEDFSPWDTLPWDSLP